MIPFHVAGASSASFLPFVSFFTTRYYMQTHLSEALFTITNFIVLDYQAFVDRQGRLWDSFSVCRDLLAYERVGPGLVR